MVVVAKMGRLRSSPVNKLFAWVRRQSMKVKIFLAVTSVICPLVALKLLIKDHNHFFIASEAVHFLGIMVLIYKLTTQKTCSGEIKSTTITYLKFHPSIVSLNSSAGFNPLSSIGNLVTLFCSCFYVAFNCKTQYLCMIGILFSFCFDTPVATYADQGLTLSSFSRLAHLILVIEFEVYTISSSSSDEKGMIF